MLASIQASLDNLTQGQTTLTTEVSGLKTEVSGLKTEVKSLSNRMTAVETELQKLFSTVTQGQQNDLQRFDSIMKRFDVQDGEIETMKATARNFILTNQTNRDDITLLFDIYTNMRKRVDRLDEQQGQ